MVAASDFRKGITFEIDGKVCTVLDFMHVKPGKGAAFVRVKYKDIINGGTVETAFKPEDKFPKAHIDRKDEQYLYDDGDMYVFMNNETYEQTMVAHDEIADSMKFVKENMDCKICSYKGKVFAVEPPITVELEVTDTEPGFKGNTATGATKPAIVETGAQVMVPLFVEIGDILKIDTRTGEYISRA